METFVFVNHDHDYVFEQYFDFCSHYLSNQEFAVLP